MVKVDTNRVAIVSLCISTALAIGILVAALSVRTHDLERINQQDARELAELAVLHQAICDMRTGYRERQALFSQFLTGRPAPPYDLTRALVVSLSGSFAETLFALRTLDCDGPLEHQ